MRRERVIGGFDLQLQKDTHTVYAYIDCNLSYDNSTLCVGWCLNNVHALNLKQRIYILLLQSELHCVYFDTLRCNIVVTEDAELPITG